MSPFSVRSKVALSTKSAHSDKEITDEPTSEPKFPTKQFEYIEGRNYRQTQNKTEQLLPCDDEEIERLQINHLLFKSLFPQRYFAPVEHLLEKGIKVLDVSAGPGWWALDMAKRYPKSYFVATDVILYPISQPPANCHFRLTDISNGLVFPDNSFDFVTQHDVLFKYGKTEWELIIPELVRVTKPGGYIEFVEVSGNIQDVGPNLSIWLMRLTVSLQARNINLKMPQILQSKIELLPGVTHLESSHRSVPIGWYGKNGDIMLECVTRFFGSIKARLCEDWSMNTAKYDTMVQAAAVECREYRSWSNIHYTIAQKNQE
ncbi:S-adenosyl-L-methionine-dependent methyltransferase [Sporodiniella umbellata]|nr:S-adenosyl-L-methionine-dependent methyltransferase [Sporodiniella umbellata]